MGFHYTCWRSGFTLTNSAYREYSSLFLLTCFLPLSKIAHEFFDIAKNQKGKKLRKIFSPLVKTRKKNRISEIESIGANQTEERGDTPKRRMRRKREGGGGRGGTRERKKKNEKKKNEKKKNKEKGPRSEERRERGKS